MLCVTNAGRSNFLNSASFLHQRESICLLSKMGTKFPFSLISMFPPAKVRISLSDAMRTRSFLWNLRGSYFCKSIPMGFWSTITAHRPLLWDMDRKNPSHTHLPLLFWWISKVSNGTPKVCSMAYSSSCQLVYFSSWVATLLHFSISA